jgi:hypothetical protein
VTTRDYLAKNQSITEVRFVCLGAQALEIYRRLLASSGAAEPPMGT